MKKGKIILVVAMVCLIIVTSTNVYGEEVDPLPTVDPDSLQIQIIDAPMGKGLHRITPGGGSGDAQIMAKQFLKIWMLNLSKPAANELRAWGETQTYEPVQSIGVTLYLQAQNKHTKVWTDLTKLATFTNSNQDRASGVVDISGVQSGYHYRIRSVHFAKDGNVHEEAGSVTASIYMD